MVLYEMIYDPSAQQGQAAISLLQGAFTFVSGQIAKTGVDAMVIETPTATIGIRGTAGGGRRQGQHRRSNNHRAGERAWGHRG